MAAGVDSNVMSLVSPWWPLVCGVSLPFGSSDTATFGTVTGSTADAVGNVGSGSSSSTMRLSFLGTGIGSSGSSSGSGTAGSSTTESGSGFEDATGGSLVAGLGSLAVLGRAGDALVVGADSGFAVLLAEAAVGLIIRSKKLLSTGAAFFRVGSVG